MVRYAAKNIAMERNIILKYQMTDIVEILGAPRLERDKYENNDVAGVVTGLAWTRVGGDIFLLSLFFLKEKGL